MAGNRWLRASLSKRPRRAMIAGLILAVAALLVGPAFSLEAGAAPHQHKMMHPRLDGIDSVARQLMCTCGCNLTVAACEGTMTCDIAARMRKEALDKLSKGMSTNEVLASFAADYGEQVLAAPTKKGFNLTAWILPFVALAAGVLVVTVALTRWRRRPAVVVAGTADVPAPDSAYLARVEEEVARDQ